MKNLPLLLDRLRERWLLAPMLLALHIALHSDFGSPLSAALMTVHLGLFFLWQPIWQRDQRLDLRSAAYIILFAAAFIASLGWWTIFGWLILLIGIVAGRSFSTRYERYAYMVTLAFLVSELLIECVPMLFRVGMLPPVVMRSFELGLTILPLVIFALPDTRSLQSETFPVDFFRGITFALMTALLAVGSVLITLDTGADYPIALVGSLIAMGAFLVMISWLISPGAGGGLGSLWEKSLLNIGTRFESWLGSVARQADQQHSPQEFLEAAVAELVELPWVAGVAWRTERAEGVAGDTSGNRTALETKGLAVSLYTEGRLSPALLPHCRLLVQVLGHFYTAKLRESEHAQQAHMLAIHETGARLTHDIKNLLQSLQNVTSALHESSLAQDEDRMKRGQSLLARQLPQITQRLQLALDKLQQPQSNSGDYCALDRWWRQLLDRYDGREIVFRSDVIADGNHIPGDCFDSVVENLIDNARNKAKVEPGLTIRVSLSGSDDGVTLAVSDNGSAIEAGLAERMFRQPLASENGLGVGLYQAARQAALVGYRIRLAENCDGDVRFELSAEDG